MTCPASETSSFQLGFSSVIVSIHLPTYRSRALLRRIRPFRRSRGVSSGSSAASLSLSSSRHLSSRSPASRSPFPTFVHRTLFRTLRYLVSVHRSYRFSGSSSQVSLDSIDSRASLLAALSISPHLCLFVSSSLIHLRQSRFIAAFLVLFTTSSQHHFFSLFLFNFDCSSSSPSPTPAHILRPAMVDAWAVGLVVGTGEFRVQVPVPIPVCLLRVLVLRP